MITYMVDTCGEVTKRQYNSQSAAFAALIDCKLKNRRERSCYKCRACGCYHLTKRRPDLQEKKAIRSAMIDAIGIDNLCVTCYCDRRLPVPGNCKQPRNHTP